jgi:hypothetical protein
MQCRSACRRYTPLVRLSSVVTRMPALYARALPQANAHAERLELIVIALLVLDVVLMGLQLLSLFGLL